MKPVRDSVARGHGEAGENRRIWPGIRSAMAVALVIGWLVIFPAGAALSMMPVLESVQIGEVVTLSGTNTENTTTFLFLTGPNLDADGVMLTNTSLLAKDGFFDTAGVKDYSWKFVWNTSLPGVNLDEGLYVVYASTNPLRRSSLVGRTYVQQVVTFRGRLLPVTTATTQAPTPVPTWTPPPDGTDVRVSSTPSDDYPGRSEGDFIVYEARRGEGDSDIYLYNISSGNTTPVATGPALQKSPSLSMGKVVYSASEIVKFERSDADLFIYDIATGKTSRLTRPGDQLNPRISGSIIAFQDETPGRSSVNIVLHDLLTNVTVKVPAKTRAYLPDISGRRVIWLDDPLTPAVYLYDTDGKSVRKVLNKTGIKGTTAIDGARITWADTKDDFEQVYVLDLGTGTETRVTTDSSNHFSPAISGDRVVWVDFRSGNRDIYLYDLPARRETVVTTSKGQQVAPQISGCTVAWADDRDEGSYDVYYQRIPGCAPSPAPGLVSLEPEVTATPAPETPVATPTEMPATSRATTTATTRVPPSTPVPTTKPPGFGALTALAGLAALVILSLMRRPR